jgi:hypothetical protein
MLLGVVVNAVGLAAWGADALDRRHGRRARREAGRG